MMHAVWPNQAFLSVQQSYIVSQYCVHETVVQDVGASVQSVPVLQSPMYLCLSDATNMVWRANHLLSTFALFFFHATSIALVQEHQPIPAYQGVRAVANYLLLAA